MMRIDRKRESRMMAIAAIVLMVLIALSMLVG